MYVCMNDDIAVSTRTLTPLTTGSDWTLIGQYSCARAVAWLVSARVSTSTGSMLAPRTSYLDLVHTHVYVHSRCHRCGHRVHPP